MIIRYRTVYCVIYRRIWFASDSDLHAEYEARFLSILQHFGFTEGVGGTSGKTVRCLHMGAHRRLTMGEAPPSSHRPTHSMELAHP